MSARTVGWSVLGLIVAAIAVGSAAAEEVTCSVHGPEDSHLGAYRGHQGHPRRSWTAHMRTGTTHFELAHWVDVHPSHAPKVLPLEGMIGLRRPTHANWYANGFLNIRLASGERVGTVPIEAIRVSEEGARGALEFKWVRAEGTWRAKFIALVADDRLFCEVRHWPGETPAEWEVSLDCYPGRQDPGGERVVTTGARELENGASEAIDPARECWMALTDRVWDPAHGLGDGGATLIFAPEDVSAANVEVTDYPVHVDLAPAGDRMRLVVRESFQETPNAELVAGLRASADERLADLRQLRFAHRSVFSDDWQDRHEEIQELLAALDGPDAEADRARDLAETIERLTAQLRADPAAAGPDAESQLADAMQAQRELLWELRWDELLRP
jgi:hypothetical protein